MASKYAQSWKVKILELGIFTMLDFLRQYVQLVQTLLQGFLNNPNLRDNSVTEFWAINMAPHAYFGFFLKPKFYDTEIIALIIY